MSVDSPKEVGPGRMGLTNERTRVSCGSQLRSEPQTIHTRGYGNHGRKVLMSPPAYPHKNRSHAAKTCFSTDVYKGHLTE